MAARILPIVRNLTVSTEEFTVGSRDVLDGCVATGPHRLLRFDILCHNAGDADLVLEPPGTRPDLFEFSPEDGRYRLRDFVHVALEDAAGNPIGESHKRSFCLIDVERIEPGAREAPQFTDCNVRQGISAGWADVYRRHLPCQYVVIDEVPDGDYRLRVDVDAPRVVPGAGVASLTVALRLDGDTVALRETAPAPPPPPRTEWPLEALAHDVLDAADLSAVPLYLAPGFLGHGLVPFDGAAGPIDAAGYRSLLADQLAAFAEIRTVFGLRIVERDWIARSWTRTALHVGAYHGAPATQRPVEVRGVTVARIERGQLAEQWDVVDAGWLAALGGTRLSALEPAE
jgi:hypothetical protein